MNFLAHAYLSGDHEKILVGNFIGDFVKGKSFNNYPLEIANGIKLHRAIDEYTDNHSETEKSKILLREKYRHYSGVIVDVMYDHFLASQWSLYHSKKLETYTEELYSTLKSYEDILPERFRFVLEYMSRDNWLLHYSRLEGIDQALSGMARRTKFNSKMELAVGDIKVHYEVFQNHFDSFMPDIMRFVDDWLEENTN